MRSGSFQFAIVGVSTRSFAHSPAAESEQADESLGRSVPLLSEYGSSWLESISGLVSNVTLQNYSGQLARHVLPRLGDRQLDEIDVGDILILIRELQELGYAGWTIQSILKPLSRVFTHAQRSGVITVNPISQLERRERPRIRRSEQRILNREEIGRLLEAAAPRYRTLLATAVLSGLRQSELLGLRWRDVDLADHVIHVRSALDRQRRDKPPKTERAVRDVVLMPGLARLLETHRTQSAFGAAGDYVFTTEVGTPLHWANVSKRALKPALKNAGLPPIRWHDLRHTFASMLIAGGANVVFVSHQLGHSSTDITLRIYAHSFGSAEQADRTREMLEEMFGEVL